MNLHGFGVLFCQSLADQRITDGRNFHAGLTDGIFLNVTGELLPCIFMIKNSFLCVKSWILTRLYDEHVHMHVVLIWISPDDLLNFACIP